MATITLPSSPVSVAVPSPLFPLTPGAVGRAAEYFGTPAPARKAVYRYALADVQGRAGPWSPPVTISHPAGGGVCLRHSDFAPTHPECVGYFWSIDGLLGVICEGGTSPQGMGCTSLCAMPGPRLITDIRKTGNVLPGPSRLFPGPPPPAPILYPFSVPNVDLELAETFVTPAGETAPSPWIKSPRNTDTDSSGVGYRTIYSRNACPPGTLFRRLYGRSGGTYYRLGDFDHDCQTMFATTAVLCPAPTPFAPLVELSPLQLALNSSRTGDVIVIDQAEVVSAVPIVDTCGDGNEREGVHVTGRDGANWTLRYTGTGPAVVMRNRRLHWDGAQILGGSVGMAFADSTAGQAFAAKFYGCFFQMGMRVCDWAAHSYLEHTASELRFVDCRFEGPNPIRIEGAQSANIRFINTHAVSDESRRHGTAPLWIDTACRVFFDDGLFADFGHVGAYLGTRPRVRIDGLFSDRGWEAALQSVSMYPAEVLLLAATINAFGADPWLFRSSTQTVEANSKISQQQMEPYGYRTFGATPAMAA